MQLVQSFGATEGYLESFLLSHSFYNKNINYKIKHETIA